MALGKANTLYHYWTARGFSLCMRSAGLRGGWRGQVGCALETQINKWW